jgi:hypothetical protein
MKFFGKNAKQGYRIQATWSYRVHEYIYAPVAGAIPVPAAATRSPRAAIAREEHLGNKWQPGATKLTSAFTRSHCRKQAYNQNPMQPVAKPTYPTTAPSSANTPTANP